MKNTLVKTYSTVLFFFSSFMLFANDAVGDESDTGDLESAEASPAPINGKLFILIIAGIIFAYSTFRNSQKKQTE